MTGVIYCIENLVNGKMYIGQTINFKKRMCAHASGDKSANALSLAIKKYGWENFAVMQVETIPAEELDEAERFWIDFLNCKTPNGYNLKDGGANGKFSEESKQQMSQSAQRRVANGTHNFVVDHPMKKRMADGTHHWIENNPNKRRLADGTHNFLANHPQKNPEIRAKTQRSRRKNHGILDWIDMLLES